MKTEREALIRITLNDVVIYAFRTIALMVIGFILGLITSQWLLVR